MRGQVTVGYHSEPCKVRIAKEWKRAEFMGVFQDAGTDLFGQPYARPDLDTYHQHNRYVFRIRGGRK